MKLGLHLPQVGVLQPLSISRWSRGGAEDERFLVAVGQ